MLLPALAKAKQKAYQAACFNGLRQIGLGMTMYVNDNHAWTGCWAPGQGKYVWMTLIYENMGKNRKAFSCPAALPTSFWDTNLNLTLPINSVDPWAVLQTTSFSYGLNDWGIGDYAHVPQLGLGGDVDNAGGQYKGVLKDSAVVAPADMIMVVDLRSDCPTNLINFNANSHPNDDTFEHTQRPSNRHNYHTDIVFCDGHVESPIRNDTCDPTSDLWRSRWNNDHQTHYTDTFTAAGSPAPPWTYTASRMSKLEK